MLKDMQRIFRFNHKEMKFEECLFNSEELKNVFLEACKEKGIDVKESRQTYVVEIKG